MSDDDMTMSHHDGFEETVHEIDMLRYEHGTWGACVVYLRRHTSMRAWVRFALFVAAYGLLWYGGVTLSYKGPLGITKPVFTSVEAHLAALVTVAAMVATWKGLEHVLE